MKSNLTITNWDRAYAQGKYDQEGAIPFVQDIIATIKERDLVDKLGFYPGCGNGRNFVPLFDAGLNLEGNDISPVAIEQLKTRRPKASATVGDFLTHKASQQYAYVLSIQLFQHGNQEVVRQLFDKAYELLQPKGLFVLRVNSIHTQIVQEYDTTEHTPEGGFTIKYHSGQKNGLEIHFYSAEEIHALTE
ncbi:MAG TPA: class I SAM-dependent methyltransferase, partial [Candidatus Saccharimonadales bacterium]|nr:class I SAM-dependent methyltransferase [Candidatus Saccharimonadales bacterium]